MNDRRGQSKTAAIFIRYLEYMAQIYTIHGEVVVINPRRVLFAVEGVVPPNELAEVKPHFPEEFVKNDPAKSPMENQIAVPREVGTTLINRMQQLTSLAGDCYRKYTYRLDHIWEIMLRSEAAQLSSVEDVAKRIFQHSSMSMITAPMLWCLHGVMLSDERFLMDSRFHRVSPRYGFLTQKHYDDRTMVREWIRDYQEYQASDTTASFDGNSNLQQGSRRPNALNSFFRKAQTIINKSREGRSLLPTGQLGTSNVQSVVDVSRPRGAECSWPFDKNDIKILRVLSDWVLIRAIKNHTLSASIGPAILRATGMYEGLEFDRSTGFLMLKELGVIAPWENRAAYQHDWPLPGLGVDPTLDKMQKMANQRDFVLEDSMKDLRKDWVNLPVFCVDAPDTVDHDDGVSWEAADGTSSWVHIHVSNPSAFIDKDSIIAKYAARLSSAVYLVEGRYSMLETDTLRRHCSLTPGCPSITFSARMNPSAEILETKITHGILHDVRYLVPETIDKYVYGTESIPAKPSSITVGGLLPTVKHRGNNQSLTDSEIETLVKLKELGSARRLKRNPRVRFGTDFYEPKVHLGENHPPLGLTYDRNRYFVGDPIITMPIQPYNPARQPDLATSSEEFVSDLMLLAGEIAALWSAERGIPIAYTGTKGDPSLKTTREAFEKDIMQPAIQKYGFVPRQHLNQYITLSGHTATSPTPIEHLFLNMPVYCKATSPLRRYGDLFTHWQIDAAVRYEAEKRTSLIGNTEDHFLPFSRGETAEALKELDMNTQHAITAKRRSKQHWIAQWFQRAHYHEKVLPKTLTAYISRFDRAKDSEHVLGVIEELSIPCVVNLNAASRAEGDLRESDSWEVEITRVDTYTASIYADPIRLVKRINDETKAEEGMV